MQSPAGKGFHNGKATMDNGYGMLSVCRSISLKAGANILSGRADGIRQVRYAVAAEPCTAKCRSLMCVR